ncbi:hypothetical protein FE249_14920 [Acidiphilium multivorum]|uniref:hypothetical protein n=1 Tax=Acidiphilium multivorum TaxID=62140 RepID=UPI001F4C22B0|nr:hypothetical protein [Acidiphilium multivorum]UNC15414.1 hypothetical protein FE249_14920 [Acidiphilium multivorum]
MNNSRAPAGIRTQVNALIERAGRKSWAARIERLHDEAASSPRYGRLVALRHAAEFAAEKVARDLPLAPVDHVLAARVAALEPLAAGLDDAGRVRFEAALAAALEDDGTLIPLLHLHDTAERHRAMGFEVAFAGLEDGASFDLLATREGAAVEIACDTLSAEAGRLVHRAAWMRLMDRIDPDLQTWLSAHPGRYLLKMTLPRGLREAGTNGTEALAELHRRINFMLASARRSDHDEAAVLRLDPLMLAAAQASENGLMNRLRHEFGPEANLAVTGDGQGVFVLAARAGSENEVAVAMRNRLAALAPSRLTGTRPGILAMFIEDTDRLEWRLLREQLTLEGEARQFLTFPEARPVVAVTCTSRIELCAVDGADALRFRNPTHPAGKLPALAPAVLSVC